MNSIRRRSQLTLEEVRTLLAPGPHERLAIYPASVAPTLLAETFAALANANGGWVMLQSTAPEAATARSSHQMSAQATHSPFDPNTTADLVLHAALLCDPPLLLPAPQILTAELLDTEAASPQQPRGMLVQVPPGLPNVYNVRGVYPTRAGTYNRPLTTPELRRMLLERSDSACELQVIPEATIGDLDPGSVDHYLDRLMFPPAADANDLLVARRCLVSDPDMQALRPTVAGLLIFGRNPQQFIPSAEILCVRYPGTQMSDAFVRQEIGGPLQEQIRQAEAFVASNMTYAARLEGLARRDIPAYPLAVVREAIVNAVAHRDYSIRGEGIRLLLFSDRLEVYSPGRLPGHVTLENMKDERYSRNEVLVALLSDLGYIERLGYGIDRMLSVLREAGLPAPIFEETAAGFRVTLRHAEPQRAEIPSALRQPANLPSPRPVPSGPPLNERQQQALAWVAEHGRITNSELQAMTPDVSAETIRRDLADLVDRNLLLRIGSKRATYYIAK